MRFSTTRTRRIIAFVAAVIVLRLAPRTSAQDLDASPSPSPTVFQRDPSSPWYVGGQVNLILQGHPAFPALYTGEYSLTPDAEQELSRVLTLYTGLRLNPRTDVILHVESAGGNGIGGGIGLAGYTNLDVVRNPTLRGKLYIGRAEIRHVIPLGDRNEVSASGPFSLLHELPERRLEFRVGKLSIVDAFDVNAVGSDSHLQFLNWAIDANGAYDYAADTRGYTIAAIAEYHAPRWAVRFGEALMPTEANGPTLDWNLRTSRASNLEFEFGRGVLPGRTGRVRVLGYVNHANMGTYADAIARFKSGETPVPDIIATRRPGTVKYGLGLNIEQALGRGVRAFARVGWDDGRTETFAYTEVDRTISGGVDTTGGAWRRPSDKVGAAFVVNGLSDSHREYLALGGHGFLLGDGALTYGRESIVESYYTAPLLPGTSLAFDLQRIWNPGYNQDRGPVWVFGGRLHIDF